MQVEIPFTPEAKQILENCVQEARRREGSFSYKKLVVTSATLVVTGALLVVTRS